MSFDFVALKNFLSKNGEFMAMQRSIEKAQINHADIRLNEEIR